MAPFLVILYVIGNYTLFSLYAGETLIFPSVLANVSGWLLLVIYFPLTARFASQLNGGGVLLMLLALLLANIVPAMSDGDFLGRLPSTIQLLSSIASGMGFLFGLLALSGSSVRRFADRLIIVILTVGFAESYLGLSDLMREIDEVLYAWRPTGIYTDVLRDEAIWGGVRPLVFAQEPSFVAVATVLLLVTSSLLAKEPLASRNWLKLSAQLGAALVILKSGILLFFFPIFALGVVTLGPAATRSRSSIILILLLAVSVVPVVSLMGEALSRHAESGSFFARVVAPALVFIKIIPSYPLFGVGPGGYELLAEPVREVWWRVGSETNFGWSTSTETKDLIMSSWWTYWMFLGLLGGTMLGGGLTYSLVAMRSMLRPSFTLPATAIFWLTIGGGAVDARSWMVFFLFAGIPALVQKMPRRGTST